MNLSQLFVASFEFPLNSKQDSDLGHPSPGLILHMDNGFINFLNGGIFNYPGIIDYTRCWHYCYMSSVLLSEEFRKYLNWLRQDTHCFKLCYCMLHIVKKEGAHFLFESALSV